MIQIPFNIRVKLLDIKSVDVILLCNDIRNYKKILHLLLFNFFILKVKILLYYAFLIENTKLTLRRS